MAVHSGTLSILYYHEEVIHGPALLHVSLALPVSKGKATSTCGGLPFQDHARFNSSYGQRTDNLYEIGTITMLSTCIRFTSGSDIQPVKPL